MATQESPQNFPQLLEHCLEFGSDPALVDAKSGRTLTYTELYNRAYEFSRKLPSIVRAGERVLLYGLEPLEWVPMFFALALRGAIAVPVDTRMHAEFVASIVESTRPVLVVHGDNQELALSCEMLSVSALEAASDAKSIQLPETNPKSPVEIIFTSGTWSVPKGVVLSQENIMSNALQVLQVYHHAKQDTSLAVLPLSHAYQQTVGLIIPMLVGSQVVFLSDINSRALTSALEKYRVRTMLVVPRVLSLLESAILRNITSPRLRSVFVWVVPACRILPRSLRRLVFSTVHKNIGPNLDTFIVGGAALPRALDHFFQGLGYRVIVGYGASECAPVIAISLNQRRGGGEVGSPVPGMSTTFSADGELVVQGKNVFLGYWPVAAAPTEFNTEDVVTQNNRGVLALRGRTKNLIVYASGDKIFCEDIEHLANHLPGIEDSCAVEVTSNAGPTLHCVVKGDTTLLGRELVLADALNAKLPFGIRVERMHILSREEFPYTHTLKPNRKALQVLCATSATTSPQD